MEYIKLPSTTIIAVNRIHALSWLLSNNQREIDISQVLQEIKNVYRYFKIKNTVTDNIRKALTRIEEDVNFIIKSIMIIENQKMITKQDQNELLKFQSIWNFQELKSGRIHLS